MGRQYLSDGEEAPEGAQVHEGPQGGRYYITGEGDDTEAPAQQKTSEDSTPGAEVPQRREVIVDTKLSELYVEAYELDDEKRRLLDEAHARVGDRRTKKDPYDKNEIARYSLTDQEAVDKLSEEKPHRWEEIVNGIDDIQKKRAENTKAMKPLSEEYRKKPWPRFFLVKNANGHIHSSQDCKTCLPTTRFAWLTDVSGLKEKDAVEEHGPRLCTVCFPSAPLEWTEGVGKSDDTCEGAGQYISGLRYGARYTKCPKCGQAVSVSANAKLRTHKSPEAMDRIRKEEAEKKAKEKRAREDERAAAQGKTVQRVAEQNYSAEHNKNISDKALLAIVKAKAGKKRPELVEQATKDLPAALKELGLDDNGNTIPEGRRNFGSDTRRAREELKRELAVDKKEIDGSVMRFTAYYDMDGHWKQFNTAKEYFGKDKKMDAVCDTPIRYETRFRIDPMQLPPVKPEVGHVVQSEWYTKADIFENGYTTSPVEYDVVVRPGQKVGYPSGTESKDMYDISHTKDSVFFPWEQKFRVKQVEERENTLTPGGKTYRVTLEPIDKDDSDITKALKRMVDKSTRVYLQPGEEPPGGEQVEEGPRGGRYYESNGGVPESSVEPHDYHPLSSSSLPREQGPQYEHVLSFEDQHRDDEVESMVAVGADGAVLLELSTGGNRNVEFTDDEAASVAPGSVVTHNHPTSDALSARDYRFAHGQGVAEIRATRRGGGTNRAAITERAKSMSTEDFYKAVRKVDARVTAVLNSRVMRPEDAKALHWDIVGNLLVQDDMIHAEGFTPMPEWWDEAVRQHSRRGRRLRKHLPGDHDQSTHGNERSSKLQEAAVSKFGATDDWRSAGYIMPDGTMIDLKRNSNPIEHSHVARESGTSTRDAYDAIEEFCRETGALRFHPGSDRHKQTQMVIDIPHDKPLTEDQARVIEGAFRAAHAAVEEQGGLNRATLMVNRVFEDTDDLFDIYGIADLKAFLRGEAPQAPSILARYHSMNKHLSGEHDQNDHGNRDEIEEHLVNYKPDRSLTGPDAVPIGDVIEGAETTTYMRIPGIDRLHEMMQDASPDLGEICTDTDMECYSAARDSVMKNQPVETIPVESLVMTQKNVNTKKVESGAESEGFINAPVDVVKSGGKYYVLNGHHRVAARYLSGKRDIIAHVFDADRIDKSVKSFIDSMMSLSRVYLKPGQEAPEGREVIETKRGARYYEAEERKPKEKEEGKKYSTGFRKCPICKEEFPARWYRDYHKRNHLVREHGVLEEDVIDSRQEREMEKEKRRKKNEETPWNPVPSVFESTTAKDFYNKHQEELFPRRSAVMQAMFRVQRTDNALKEHRKQWVERAKEIVQQKAGEMRAADPEQKVFWDDWEKSHLNFVGLGYLKGSIDDELVDQYFAERKPLEQAWYKALEEEGTAKENLTMRDTIRQSSPASIELNARTDNEKSALQFVADVIGAGSSLDGKKCAIRTHVGARNRSARANYRAVGISEASSGAGRWTPVQNGLISVPPNVNVATVVHELGHWIEDRGGRVVQELRRAFLERRTKDEPLEALKDLFPGSGYESREMTRKDKFSSPYSGKHYNRPQDSEVISMGMQHLYEGPMEFAKTDPDYFDFMQQVFKALHNQQTEERPAPEKPEETVYQEEDDD